VAQHVQHNVGFNVVIERPQRHILHNAKIKRAATPLARGRVSGGFYSCWFYALQHEDLKKFACLNIFPFCLFYPFRKRLLDKTVRKPVQLPKAVTFPNPFIIFNAGQPARFHGHRTN
jgi:hypothetical protein